MIITNKLDCLSPVFQHGLLFASKVRAYPSVEGALSRSKLQDPGPWAVSQTLD